MPYTESDLKDLLAERAGIPTARIGRLAEVRRRIRRRQVTKAVTAITASAAAVAVVALGAPVLADRIAGRDTNGLTVVGGLSATPGYTSACVRPGGALSDVAPTGRVVVKTICPVPSRPTHESFPPAKYTINREGDGYRVTIAEMGDLEGLRRDLREMGIPAVEQPSHGFGDCVGGDYDDGPKVPKAGVWEFFVRPGRFDNDRELGISNDPDKQVIGMLLFQHWCRAK